MLHKIILDPDTNVQVQFRRKNVDENWGPVYSFKTIKNTKPPATPSTPTVVAWLGQLVVTWDGQSTTGEPYLPDFYQCEIHVSEVDDFIPTDATKVQYFNTFASNQQMTVSDLEYNTKYFVKLVVVNTAKTKSEPSAQAYATVKRISGIELEDGSINVDKTNLTARSLGGNIDYYQTAAPSTTVNAKNPPMFNDRWFDTDDNYKFYRYFNPTLTQNTDESYEAYAARQNASSNRQWLEIPLGNQVPGAKIFWQADAPVQADYPGGFKQGDTWYDSDADNRLYIWVPGSGWTAQQFGSSAFAAGSITAGKLAAGSVTANAVATNQIIAYNANIANGIIDDAKIGNVSAGKLTAGTINANILLSGYIRTATSGARIELGPQGMWLYNAQGEYTTYLSTLEGYASITGYIVARTFRSQGFQSAGYGYIEIGNTGQNDPTDEIRMFYNGAVASVRNPSDLPGIIRMSMTRPTVDTIEFYSNRITTANGFFIAPRQFPGTQLGLNAWTVTMLSAYNGAGSFFVGKDAGNFGWFHNQSGGGGIKLLNNGDTVQIRNSGDSQYGNLVTGNLQVQGSLSAASFNPSSISTSSVYSSGSISAGGSISANSMSASSFTSYGMSYFNGGLRADQGSFYVRYTSYVDDQLYVTNNVTSYNGGFYSRGSYIGSNPDFKYNIVKVDVNAQELLSDIDMYAWNWIDKDGNQTQDPGIGMLTSELPHIVTPEAAVGENGDSYSVPGLVALLIKRSQELTSENKELRDQLTAFGARLESLESK